MPPYVGMARKQNGGSLAVVINIANPRYLGANIHLGLWNSSYSSFACSVVCRITNLLLLATGTTSLQVWVGLVSSAQARYIILKVHKQASKRFQMKSNGCRDVQHTGLQSTQTSRNTGKQGAQTRGTQHIFPSIPTSVAA